MPIRDDGSATDPAIVDQFDGGFGWLPHPEEAMQRASHAVDFGDGVWIVDPLDAPGIDERIEELGEVRGVIVLLDRHERDAAAFANRFDVPVFRPPYVDREFDAPVEWLGSHLPDSDVQVLQTVDLPFWKEGALYDEETLVLADALGAAGYFAVGPERLGVHPMLRLSPPTQLRGLTPERIFVGHGEGVDYRAAEALDVALTGARWRLPQAWLAGLRSIF
ncbi:MAG: hypothetical protein ACQEQJ_09440 [Halobacteriota archaeon]